MCKVMTNRRTYRRTNRPTNGKVTCAPIGALEVKLNAHKDRPTGRPTDHQANQWTNKPTDEQTDQTIDRLGQREVSLPKINPYKILGSSGDIHRTYTRILFDG